MKEVSNILTLRFCNDPRHWPVLPGPIHVLVMPDDDAQALGARQERMEGCTCIMNKLTPFSFGASGSSASYNYTRILLPVLAGYSSKAEPESL